MRKNEDPRLSFSTPEFKEAQRQFTEAFKVHIHFRSLLFWGLRGGVAVGVRAVTGCIKLAQTAHARAMLSKIVCTSARWCGNFRGHLLHTITAGGRTAPPLQGTLFPASHQRTCTPPLPPRLQKNFGRPVEYALVKDYDWSTPQLRKLDQPVDVDGNPWPLDAQGNPIVK